MEPNVDYKIERAWDHMQTEYTKGGRAKRYKNFQFEMHDVAPINMDWITSLPGYRAHGFARDASFYNPLPDDPYTVDGWISFKHGKSLRSAQLLLRELIIAPILISLEVIREGIKDWEAYEEFGDVPKTIKESCDIARFARYGK